MDKRTENFRCDAQEVTITFVDGKLLSTVYGKTTTTTICKDPDAWEYIRVTVMRHGEGPQEWTANMEVLQNHPEYGLSMYGHSYIGGDECSARTGVKNALRILSARTRCSMFEKYAKGRMLYALLLDFVEMFNAWDEYMAINW